MFNAYRKSQASQLNWIRNHPVQYVALNAAIIVVFVGYIELEKRRDRRKFENETTQQND